MSSATVTAPRFGNWPRFLLFPLIAVIGYAGLVWEVEQHSLWIAAGWVAILSYCWFCLAGSFHEAAHGSLFRNHFINEAYGQTVGVLILIPFSTFRATHRMHHAYMNTPKDYELWPYSNPNASLGFRRAFVWLDLFFGVFTAPFIYGRISFTKTARLTPAEKKWIPREYAFMALFWTSVIIAVGLLIHYGYYQPELSHTFLLLPLIISPMINTLRKFTEHVGMESTDPVQGTRTVCGKHWLTTACSYFLFDISVHGPHHRYPKVRGGNLKSKLKEMQQKDPARDIPVFSSYYQALMHTLPLLWTNPAVGTEKWPDKAAPAASSTTGTGVPA